MKTNKYSNQRIYAKMRPNPESVEFLISLQKLLTLNPGAKLIHQKQLHLTLIHFGRVHDIYQNISSVSDISYAEYEDLLTEYIEESETLLPTNSVTISPTAFGGFGSKGKTLALEFEPPDTLLETHQNLYQVLRKFLKNCRIEDVDSFMKDNSNLEHAHALKPHITLCRGFKGRAVDPPLQDVVLLPVPTIYS